MSLCMRVFPRFGAAEPEPTKAGVQGETRGEGIRANCSLEARHYIQYIIVYHNCRYKWLMRDGSERSSSSFTDTATCIT
jgi:hypothetical protein